MSDLRSDSGRYIRWGGIINRARGNGGEWFLALADVSVRTVELVNQRRHLDLRLPDGRLEATMRNVYEDENGLKRGDCYVKYIPKERT